MEPGAKVKMRDIEVGRVAGVTSTPAGTAGLQLEIFPDQVRFIPSNVEAEIRATTAFGAKYVDLMAPSNASAQRITAGEVLQSRNVTVEVNTVFENLTQVLRQIDPAKLNAVLSAFADGLRGQGQRIGEATTDTTEVLAAINPRMDTVDKNWQSLKGFADTYSVAAPNIIATLRAATTTSNTVNAHASQLDALLLSTVGFSQAGIDLLVPNASQIVDAVDLLLPTTDLLMKYNPEYTCLLTGAKFLVDNGARAAVGGNGKSIILDGGMLFGDDPYRYPDNLPIVAAKGGPGGKPGCGSLPDVAQNYPVRQLITNTGWGTGLDARPNPGIGHPWWVDYFPVTRAVPEPPSFRGEGPPAIGPVPYPGAPPYGESLYAPDGTPLWPGLPPAPQASQANPPDPSAPPTP